MVNRVIRKIRSIVLHTRIRSMEEWMSIAPFNKLKKEDIEANARLLKPHHDIYIRDVSSPAMAASLELAALLLTLCQQAGYRKLADLGSGFTSYVLRLYAKSNPGTEVYSIDDAGEWLGKTRSYLEASGVTSERVMMLDDFLLHAPRDFDFILHDLNFVEVRINYVQDLLGRVRGGGLLLLDDMHKPDYRIEVLKKLSGTKYELYDLKPLTLDALGRYSMAAIRP